MHATPPVPRELHIYYNDHDQTADVVVVFSLGSGQPATKLNGDALLGYRHEHRDGGAAPSTDAIHVDLTFRDARQPAAGRHRIRPAVPGEVAA